MIDPEHDLPIKQQAEVLATRLRAVRALLDGRDERAHDGQCHVGLEQGDAYLAGSGVDVLFGQPTLAPQRREDLVESVGEGVEHAGALRAGWAGWSQRTAGSYADGRPDSVSGCDEMSGSAERR